MPFIAAKCTQCGANIQVDDTKERGFCSSCGTPFITEQVVNHYHTTNVVTQNFSTVNQIQGSEVHIHQNGEGADECFETLKGLIARGKIEKEDNGIFQTRWKEFQEKFPLDYRRNEIIALLAAYDIHRGNISDKRRNNYHYPKCFLPEPNQALAALRELKAVNEAGYGECRSLLVNAMNETLFKISGKAFAGDMFELKWYFGGLKEDEIDSLEYSYGDFLREQIKYASSEVDKEYVEYCVECLSRCTKLWVSKIVNCLAVDDESARRYQTEYNNALELFYSYAPELREKYKKKVEEREKKIEEIRQTIRSFCDSYTGFLKKKKYTEAYRLMSEANKYHILDDYTLKDKNAFTPKIFGRMGYSGNWQYKKGNAEWMEVNTKMKNWCINTLHKKIIKENYLGLWD